MFIVDATIETEDAEDERSWKYVWVMGIFSTMLAFIALGIIWATKDRIKTNIKNAYRAVADMCRQRVNTHNHLCIFSFEPHALIIGNWKCNKITPERAYQKQKGRCIVNIFRFVTRFPSILNIDLTFKTINSGHHT